MPERIDALDQISVASPCSADWDEMTGNDQVRFCRHCSKHVHDLSKLTRKDAMRLVAASEGRLCVRYRKRPDGTLDTAERAAEPLTHIKRRLSRIAAGAFTASLSLASNVAAQSARPAGVNQPAAIQPSNAVMLGRVLVRRGGAGSLAGTVSDLNKAVVAGAKVTLANDTTGETQKVISDEEGAYQFQSVEAGVYTLTIEAMGFSVFEQKQVVVRDGARERVDATLEPPALMGDVAISLPNTPLVKAVWERSLNKVRNLLAEGADVNAVDDGVYTTALGAAVADANLELIQALLDAGADPNVLDRWAHTALMSMDGDATPEIVRVLVAAGAELHPQNPYRNSVLHAVADVVKPEVLRALLDAGARVNAENPEGRTALMVAAAGGNVRNVEALLLAGADPHRKTIAGQTALKLAEWNGHKEVVALLQSHGAYE